MAYDDEKIEKCIFSLWTFISGYRDYTIGTSLPPTPTRLNVDGVYWIRN